MDRRTVATKHGDEALASAVMHAALGVTVATHDDQSRPAMFDLILTYPDGRRAAAEVVSTRDQASMELEAAIAQLGYVPRPELTRTWHGDDYVTWPYLMQMSREAETYQSRNPPIRPADSGQADPREPSVG